jgi:hypothetical protein
MGQTLTRKGQGFRGEESRYFVRFRDFVAGRHRSWSRRRQNTPKSRPLLHLGSPARKGQPFQRGSFLWRSSRSVEVWPPFWYAAFFGGGFFGPRGCFR